VGIEGYIVVRIDMIQKELDELRRFLLSGEGEIVNLQGIWAGADITEEEIEEAKRSLFKGIEIGESH